MSPPAVASSDESHKCALAGVTRGEKCVLAAATRSSCVAGCPKFIVLAVGVDRFRHQMEAEVVILLGIGELVRGSQVCLHDSDVDPKFLEPFPEIRHRVSWVFLVGSDRRDRESLCWQLWLLLIVHSHRILRRSLAVFVHEILSISHRRLPMLFWVLSLR